MGAQHVHAALASFDWHGQAVLPRLTCMFMVEQDPAAAEYKASPRRRGIEHGPLAHDGTEGGVGNLRATLRESLPNERHGLDVGYLQFSNSRRGDRDSG